MRKREFSKKCRKKRCANPTGPRPVFMTYALTVTACKNEAHETIASSLEDQPVCGGCAAPRSGSLLSYRNYPCCSRKHGCSSHFCFLICKKHQFQLSKERIVGGSASHVLCKITSNPNCQTSTMGEKKTETERVQLQPL